MSVTAGFLKITRRAMETFTKKKQAYKTILFFNIHFHDFPLHFVRVPKAKTCRRYVPLFYLEKLTRPIVYEVYQRKKGRNDLELLARRVPFIIIAWVTYSAF